jgi:hypothetical protein
MVIEDKIAYYIYACYISPYKLCLAAIWVSNPLRIPFNITLYSLFKRGVNGLFYR